MITIEEKLNKKIPGTSSLYIKFDYNKEIVEALKECATVGEFDRKTLTWEVPASDLAKIVDRLSAFDSIDLILLPDVEEKKQKEPTLHSFKTKPFPYQEEGIKYGLTHDSWMLLDAPGLGKTLQMLYLALELKKAGKIDHCLIICGVNTLKFNWKREIEKHTDEQCYILGQRISKKGKFSIGSVSDRVADLKKEIDEFFVVTNIETLRDPDIVKGINKGANKFDLIIIDEVHRCFDYDTIIKTDRGDLKIGDIVSRKIECKALSYNFDTLKQEFKDVVDYHCFSTDKTIRLTFLDDNGKECFVECTPDHLIYTENRGWVEAKDLTETDFIKNYNF